MLKKFLLPLLVPLFLVACQPGLVLTEQPDDVTTPTRPVGGTILPSPTLPPSPTNKPPPLATPQSDSPAAGICDFYPGELVVFEIYPDIPSPRCARATPKQRLKVINRTEGEMRFWIGKYEFTLQPGEEQVVDAEFSTYLAPGVHRISTTAYMGEGGPELWLTTDP